MKCPSCSASPLQPISLESQLKASGCNDCEGRWISTKNYWAWLDQHGDRLPEKEPDGISLDSADTQRAKLCPQCQHIMLRYKVGHGLDFAIDQSRSCNGEWLDAKEWDLLKQRNLHDEIHLVFSAAWQAQLRKDSAKKGLSDTYSEHFKDEYDKIKQLKTWLNSHPQKARILDYLTNSDPYSISR